MTRLSSLTIVLSVGGFLLSSCVTNKCSLPEFENEADCQPQDTPPGMDSVFDVSSQRWSLEKDVTTTLIFTPATLTSEQSPAIESVSLLQGGVPFPVPPSSLVNGTLSVKLGTLSAGTSHLKPGPVTLVINGTQELAARLYIPPKFDPKMISKDITMDLTANGKLRSVRAVGLLNYQDGTSAKATLGVLNQDVEGMSPGLALFTYDLGSKVAPSIGPKRLGTGGRSAFIEPPGRDGFAVSMAQGFQVASRGVTGTFVHTMPAPQMVEEQEPQPYNSISRIISLSTDEKGSLYAGIVDKKVVVSRSVDFTKPLTLKGSGTADPVLVLVGELNGDGQADVVSWDKSGSAFVTMSSGNGFQDTVASADFKLQSASGPVALGDMDLDGIADLVTVPSGTSPVLMVKFGDGKGGVAESTSLSFSATTTTPMVAWKQIDQIAVSVGGAESPLVRGVAVAGKTDKDITVIGVLSVTHPQ